MTGNKPSNEFSGNLVAAIISDNGDKCTSKAELLSQSNKKSHMQINQGIDNIGVDNQNELQAVHSNNTHTCNNKIAYTLNENNTNCIDNITKETAQAPSIDSSTTPTQVMDQEFFNDKKHKTPWKVNGNYKDKDKESRK